MVIVGRTSAASINNLEDAIARGLAYQAVGVDAMFFTGVSSRAAVEAVSGALDIPIFLGGSGGGVLGDRDYLAKNYVRISLQGHHPFMAAVQATYATLRALRDGTPPAKITGKASSELMAVVSRGEDYQRWMNDFLGN